MRYEASFVVETCAHVTTLYKPKEGGAAGELEFYDNTPRCFYDMERYGVDMCIIKSSGTGGRWPGPTNEIARLAELVDKYPDKFRACCGSNVDRQTLDPKVMRGEKKWSVDVAVQDMEAVLKTGKFVGIGEFLPRNLDPKHVYTFEERLDEVRMFAELARKYKVTLDWHDFIMHDGWDPYDQLFRLAQEYPDVTIIVCHGSYSIGSYARGAYNIRKACSVAGNPRDIYHELGGAKNVYLECGTWPAEYFEFALKDPNLGPTQLIWGGDYGNVPQYVTAHPGEDPSSYVTTMKRWPRVPSYQTEWWGWSLHQIRKLRDSVTQDEINLILGGNAAKIFKLRVPYPRMFPDGRPDLYGIYWKESVPFIPDDQICNP